MNSKCASISSAKSGGSLADTAASRDSAQSWFARGKIFGLRDIEKWREKVPKRGIPSSPTNFVRSFPGRRPASVTSARADFFGSEQHSQTRQSSPDHRDF